MSLTTVLHSEDNRKGKDPDGGSKSKSKIKVSLAKSSDKRRNSIPPDSNKKTEKRKVGVTAASLVKSKSKPTKKVDASKKVVAPSEEIGLVLPNKVEKKSSITEIVQDEVLQKLKQSHKRRRKSLETDSMRNISYKIQTLWSKNKKKLSFCTTFVTFHRKKYLLFCKSFSSAHAKMISYYLPRRRFSEDIVPALSQVLGDLAQGDEGVGGQRARADQE